eukprot:534420-Pleurochrysis_carterae.AAC.1
MCIRDSLSLSLLSLSNLACRASLSLSRSSSSSPAPLHAIGEDDASEALAVDAAVGGDDVSAKGGGDG